MCFFQNSINSVFHVRQPEAFGFEWLVGLDSFIFEILIQTDSDLLMQYRLLFFCLTWLIFTMSAYGQFSVSSSVPGVDALSVCTDSASFSFSIQSNIASATGVTVRHPLSSRHYLRKQLIAEYRICHPECKFSAV